MITMTMKSSETGVEVTIPVEEVTDIAVNGKVVTMWNSKNLITLLEVTEENEDFAKFLYDELKHQFKTKKEIHIGYYTSNERMKRTPKQELEAENAMNLI